MWQLVLWPSTMKASHLIFLAFPAAKIFVNGCSLKIHAHHFCIFHNLKAYDFSFITQYLQENRLYPEVIDKRLKFLQIYVRNLNITI